MQEKDKMPLISVVVPVYNIEAYIEECISSIISQSYQNIEIILVDDGSDDRSGNICDTFAKEDKRIKVIHQKNSGVVSARKAGIAFARGEYVSFVDGDDWIESEMLERMMAYMDSADVISAGVDWEEKKGHHIRKRDLFLGVYDLQNQGMDEIFGRMVYDLAHDTPKPLTTWMCNKLYRKEKLERIYPIVDQSLTFSEDSILVYAYYLECNKAVFIEDVLYHYRYRDDSACHKIDSAMPAKVGIVYEKLYGLFDSCDPCFRLKEQLRRWLLDQYYKILNEKTDGEGSGRVIRYLTDTGSLKDQAVVLYGAGRVGQDLYYQLEAMGIDVVAWADIRAEECVRRGLPVVSPDSIKKVCYDLVLIAIEDESLAQQVKDDILEQNLAKEPIKIADIHKLF